MLYGTVDGLVDYTGLRGRVVVDDAPTLQALQRASDYITTRYVLRLAPLYDEDSGAVIEATYIAAGFELDVPGFWSTTFTPSQTKVLTKVRDISWTPIAGGITGVDAMLPTSPAIDGLFVGARNWGLGPLLV